MKLKNYSLTLLFLIIIISFFMYENKYLKKPIDSETKAAETVVKNYFLYRNQKNEEKELSTLTEYWKDVHSGYDNLDSIKLIHIEQASDNDKKSYLTDSKESGIKIKDNNVKAFNVQFYMKFEDDNKAPVNSGIFKWTFYVIRKDKKSPWLIESFGEA